MKDRYLGDGVYASFDGYHLWLDLRAQRADCRIALEPQVLAELDRFRSDLAHEHCDDDPCPECAHKADLDAHDRAEDRDR